MELTRILEGYSDEALDQLAADKIEEISNLRLPRSVLIQEIATALSSLSYVANALAPTRPPAYAFVKLLLDAPEHAIEVKGFADQVADLTDSITARVAEGRGLSSAKDYDLYLAILATAFESDGMIDRTEALLLSSLRRQLGIWTREHLLLEHHPDVRAFWEGGQPFERARNHLLTTGLVLTDQDRYVVADEVCRAIRRAWEHLVPYPLRLSLLPRLCWQHASIGRRGNASYVPSPDPICFPIAYHRLGHRLIALRPPPA